MLFDLDKSGGRCEQCHVLLGAASSYVTRTYTPPSAREDFAPAVVVRARQCAACAAGACASVLGPYHAQTGARCKGKRQRGLGACAPCARIIHNMAARFGFESGAEGLKHGR